MTLYILRGTKARRSIASDSSLAETVARPAFRRTPRLTLIPRPAGVYLAVVSFACRIIEELVDQLRRGRNFSDAEGRLPHALQRKGKGAHMSNLSGHEELERVLGAGVPTEVDQTFIDDFRSGLRGDIAAQINVELARDFQVVGRPRIAHRIGQVDASAASDRRKRVDLGLLSDRFQRLEVQAGEGADNFQVAEFLGPISISNSN